jgi:hypothetical protein
MARLFVEFRQRRVHSHRTQGRAGEVHR